jgi:hypothetical protein
MALAKTQRTQRRDESEIESMVAFHRLGFSWRENKNQTSRRFKESEEKNG